MAHLALLAVLLISCNFAIYGQDNVLAQARLEPQKGQTASAISSLQDYRRQHPTDPEICGLLGMAYNQQGKPDDALAMFKEFVRLAPGRPGAYVYLGATYMQLGKKVQPEQSFRHSLSLVPNNANTLCNLGMLLNTQHQYSSAHRLLLRAFQHERTPEIIF